MFSLNPSDWENFDVCVPKKLPEGDAEDPLSGYMSCSVSNTLPSSICSATNLLLRPDKIKVSLGGEEIASVAGRAEDAEFPQYSGGAYSLAGCDSKPWSPGVAPHQIGKMLGALSYVDSKSFPADGEFDFEDRATLFVTRMEYCNMYHTMTEWFAAYQTLEFARLDPREEVLVVFLDGHAKGNLDEPWGTIFGAEVVRVSSYKRPVLFRNVHWVPTGYSSPLNLHIDRPSSCSNVHSVRHFAKAMMFGYHLPGETDETAVPPDPSKLTIEVLVVQRKNYIAHPRNMVGEATRTLANPEEVTEAINKLGTKAIGPNGASVTIRARLLAFTDFSFEEQLKLMLGTDILVGVHGAGLSHVVSLPRWGGLVELFPSPYTSRLHFQNFCKWVSRHCAQVPSHFLTPAMGNDRWTANPEAVAREVENIARRVAPLKWAEDVVPAPDAVAHPMERAEDIPWLNPRPDAATLTEHGIPGPEYHPPVKLLPKNILDEKPEAQKHRLCVLVPFRDSNSNTTQGLGRTRNLKQFVPYMEKWLVDRGVPNFKIVVAEQEQGLMFNKGTMFNAAFLASYQDCDYVSLHDVDHVPINEKNVYGWPQRPTHQCTRTTQEGFEGYPQMVGGALIMQSKQYLACGGYSNGFWGWGREDDDMYQRLRDHNLDRLDVNTGSYRALPHQRVMGLDVTPQFDRSNSYVGRSERRQVNYQEEGVRRTSVTLTSVVANEPTYAHYIFRIDTRWNLVKPGATLEERTGVDPLPPWPEEE